MFGVAGLFDRELVSSYQPPHLTSIICYVIVVIIVFFMLIQYLT